MVKGIVFPVITIIVVLMLLRVWYYRDERALESKWRILASSAMVKPPRHDARQLDGLPDAAQRFFTSSIQNHTPLYTLVEITMHGEFSLGDKSMPRYQPFQACQLLAPPLGFIWQVKAGEGILQFSGSDAAFPGGSWTRFWLAGLLPVARVGNTWDHALSSFGRHMGEAIFWSPASLLPSEKVVWKEIDFNTAQVTVTHEEFEQEYTISVDAGGRLEQVQFERWSDANAEKVYRYQPFGGYLSDFQNFDGLTLPTSVVAGNHFGTDEYFPFFKAHIDSVKFITDSQTERTCVIGD